MNVSIECVDYTYKCIINNMTSETLIKRIEDGKMIEIEYERNTIYINGNYIVSVRL